MFLALQRTANEILMSTCRVFETNNATVHSRLLPVLERLLQFTPDDSRPLNVQ